MFPAHATYRRQVEDRDDAELTELEADNSPSGSESDRSATGNSVTCSEVSHAVARQSKTHATTSLREHAPTTKAATPMRHRGKQIAEEKSSKADNDATGWEQVQPPEVDGPAWETSQDGDLVSNSNEPPRSSTSSGSAMTTSFPVDKRSESRGNGERDFARRVEVENYHRRKVLMPQEAQHALEVRDSDRSTGAIPYIKGRLVLGWIREVKDTEHFF